MYSTTTAMMMYVVQSAIGSSTNGTACSWAPDLGNASRRTERIGNDEYG